MNSGLSRSMFSVSSAGFFLIDREVFFAICGIYDQNRTPTVSTRELLLSVTFAVGADTYMYSFGLFST